MATRAKVNPRTTTPTHTVTISDGIQNWGLRLEGEYKSIQESPQSPSTVLSDQKGGEYGDFDPAMSHIQQSAWRGGRASERFVDDNTRFFDSKNMWTTTDGVIHPSLQWRYLAGDYISHSAIQLAKNYSWKSLANITRSVSFVTATSWNAARVELWIRKVGTPADLTVEIRGNTGVLPQLVAPSATVVASEVITSTVIADNDVHNYSLTLDPVGALSHLTPNFGIYHLIAYGASTDNAENHWEIMTSTGAVGTAPYSYTSVDRSTWTEVADDMYYRITAAPTAQKWKFFQLKGVLYAAILGTAKFYKIETSTDSYVNKSYDDYKTTEITGHGLTLIKDVIVVNNIAYFGQGSATVIRRWNGTTWADDKATIRADMFCEHSTTADGSVLYRYVSGTGIAKSEIKSWGTNLSFGSESKLGKDIKITNMSSYQGKLYIFSTDSIWSIDADNKISKFNSRVDDATDTANGRAVIEHGQYLFFTLDKSLEQLYGTSLNDVGPHHGAGLPGDRTGYISCLETAFSHLFVGVDGGTSNYSSILMFDGVNYHEVWRAPMKGKSISTMYWYSNKAIAYPVLFFDYGGQLCFIKYPDFGFTPSKDSDIYYVPEADMITSTFDMNITRRPKFFNEFSIISKNLFSTKSDFALSTKIDADSRILVYYQIDNDINSDNWTYAGTIASSPFGSVFINRSNCYAIRIKYKLLTSDANIPASVSATVLEGFARTPIKYQWVLRLKTSSLQSTLNGAPDHNPDKLLKWLKEKAASAELVTLHSQLIALDLKSVVIEPPATSREYVDATQKSWGGVITLVLREA
jgi:hypothetical protein